MAVMFAKLYLALKSAGADDATAASAAEEMASSLATTDAVTDLSKDVAKLDLKVDTLAKDVASVKTDNAILKWMVGFNLALTVALLGLVLRGLH